MVAAEKCRPDAWVFQLNKENFHHLQRMKKIARR